jgi:hypothetical protein
MVKKFQSINTEREFGFEQKPLRVYTSADFPKVHAKLSCYWEEGKFNREQFLVDCGATTKEGAVIVQNYHLLKNKAGEDYPVCDAPSQFARARNLLEWYLPETGNYPKIDVRKEMKQLQDNMRFEVRPLLDDENQRRADEPF